MTPEIHTAIEKFRRGDRETAFFDLIELPGNALSGIIDAFCVEQRTDIRAFLAKAAWQRREPAVLPFLAQALGEDAEEVWQEALDGLVAHSCAESLKILQSARSRTFTAENAAKRFHLWLEEAIQQVESELRSL